MNYVLTSQPAVTYVSGYGIGRPGYPKEWTAIHNSEPTDKDWERWRLKALTQCRWKKCRDLICSEGQWKWVLD